MAVENVDFINDSVHFEDLFDVVDTTIQRDVSFKCHIITSSGVLDTPPIDVLRQVGHSGRLGILSEPRAYLT